MLATTALKHHFFKNSTLLNNNIFFTLNAFVPDFIDYLSTKILVIIFNKFLFKFHSKNNFAN